MTPNVLLALVLIAAAAAVAAGAATLLLLGGDRPAQRRLREAMAPASASLASGDADLIKDRDPRLEKLSRLMPKSTADMGAQRKRLIRAGYSSPLAVVIYTASEIVLPSVLGLLVFSWLPKPQNFIFGFLAAALGYALPGLVLGFLISSRQKQIRHGLPDALDLMVICVEAGSALDQAIARTAQELHLSHPELAAELELLNTETRAGKPRLEAFRNLADRTGVDEIRTLVTMLIQTDRFGTSVAQALRTHAETLRTIRRQKAEERAAKLGVKVIIPVIFFLFPALFVVLIGPAVVKIFETLGGSGSQ